MITLVGENLTLDKHPAASNRFISHYGQQEDLRSVLWGIPMRRLQSKVASQY
jgi:hypothetical protein